MTRQARARGKAQAVLVAVVRAAGEILRTNMYKAFWLAHLSAIGRTGHELSDWPIVKMPNGPGIDRFDELLAGAGGVVVEEEVPYGDFTGKQLQIADPAAAAALIKAHLSDAEVESIEDSARLVAKDTATQASEISHKLSRSWRLEPDLGRELDIYMDLLLKDEDFDRVKARMRKDGELAAEILGS